MQLRKHLLLTIMLLAFPASLHAELTFMSSTDKYATVRLSNDLLSVSFTEFTHRGVRSTKSISPGSGMFYFEGKRLISPADMGFAVTTAADTLAGRFGLDDQSVAINFLGSIFSSGVYQGSIPNSADTYGVVVDYRGTNPIIHFIGSATANGPGKFLLTYTMSTVTTAVYIGAYGVGPSGQERLRLNAGDNLGASPFRYDPLTVLTEEYYRYLPNNEELVPGWGVPDSGLNHFPLLTPGGPQTVILGNPVTVTASASDNEDGNLTSAISYVSSEGPTGTGASISFTPTTLGSGSVTASVFDSTGSGTTITKSIAVTVIASGDEDSDGDGLSYTEELALGTDPSIADTDGDFLLDGEEAVFNANPLLQDSDGDTMPDYYEATNGTHPEFDDRQADPDGDAASNEVEWLAGSHPLKADSLPSDRVVFLNPADKHAQVTLNEDQHTAIFNNPTRGSAYYGVRSDVSISPGSGWYYFEGHRLTNTGSFGFGVASASESLDHFGGQTDQSFGILTSGAVYYNGAQVASLGEPELTTKYGFAVDYRGANPIVYLVDSVVDPIYTTKVVLKPQVHSGVTLTAINGPLFIYAYGSGGTRAAINPGSDPSNEPFHYPPAYTLYLAGHTTAEFMAEGWGADFTYSGRSVPQQYDPVRLDKAITPAGDRINLGPDGLSASYTYNLKMAVRANTGMYGQFRYWEANREIAAGNYGQGYISPHAFVNHLCCVSASLTGAPPCMSVNSSANVWRNLVQQASYNISNTHYGFAVDYRGSRPKVYTIIGGAVVSTLNMTDFIAPIYPMLYGNTQGFVKTNTANFGQIPFVYDAKTILTNAGVDTTDLILGWGDANDHETPVISGQSKVELLEDGSRAITLADLVAADPNSTPLTLTVANGTNYTRVGNTITPSANYDDNLVVPVTVSDGHYTSHSFDLVVQVIPVNDPPVLLSQVTTLETQEDTPLTLTLADVNVTDLDNNYPADFSLVIEDGSDYTHQGDVITPAANFFGTLSVSLRVNDGSDNSNSLALTITVHPENDLPQILGPLNTLTTPEETPLNLTLALLDVSDPDNTYPADFSLEVGDGSFYQRSGSTITPALDFNGTLSVPITVNDGTGNSPSFQMPVTVTAVNDVPQITAQSALKTRRDTEFEITLDLLSVTDQDNSYPDDFSLSIGNGSNYSFNGPVILPDPGYVGPLSVAVTVNDGHDNSASFPFTVDVCVPPAIDTAPQNQSVCKGQATSLSVVASGPEPLTYQWYKNGSILDGATSATYNIASATSTDAGSYVCRISNACDSEPTSNVTLTVNTPIAISSQPQSKTVCPNDSTSFRVTVSLSSTTPVTYQWRKNLQNINLATANTLVIDNLSLASEGSYDCLVSNICGSLASTAATLIVDGPLDGRILPSSSAAGVNPITLTAEVSCARPNVSLEWRDVTRGLILAVDENPLVIDPLPTLNTIYELAVTDELREVFTTRTTLLVANQCIYQDLNGDGCNDERDLFLLAEDWLEAYQNQSDPNGDGQIDVLDLLYIDTSNTGACP